MGARDGGYGIGKAVEFGRHLDPFITAEIKAFACHGAGRKVANRGGTLLGLIRRHQSIFLNRGSRAPLRIVEGEGKSMFSTL